MIILYSKRIDWDENCYWCGGTTSDQCSKNVYDYDGNHAPKIGEGSCFVEDSLHYCSPSSSSTSGINGTLYTSELCQLSVDIYTYFFNRLFHTIRFHPINHSF